MISKGKRFLREIDNDIDIFLDVSEGVDDFFIRDCLAVAEHDYKCETVDTPEGVVHTCKCSTELCNINFVEAGSTEQPDGPTDAPTEPADKKVKVGG